MDCLQKFKGEDAFRVMGRVVRVLRSIFQDEKCVEIINKRDPNNNLWMLDFFDYTLMEQSGKWLELYCTFYPEVAKENVSTEDVFTFAYDFMNDDKMMSLFMSQSQMNEPKTSIGSATESTEV